MIIRKFSDKRPKIVIFQGSPRDKDTCPHMESKTDKIIEWLVEQYSFMVDFVVIDLAVNQSKKSNIQPCKGCVSTAGGYHCHWKCTCYSKNNEKMPDLMYDADIYDHLEICDAFMVFSPVHWYSVTSQVKALFDRLVCANQTLTREQAIEIMGKGNAKNPEITGKFAQSGEYDYLLKNHLEGKYAAFFIHGDDGANDYKKNPKPESLTQNLSEEELLSQNVKLAVMPIVMQCRYSGINVPDNLIQAFYMNKGKDYYTANVDLVENMQPFVVASELMENLLSYL